MINKFSSIFHDLKHVFELTIDVLQLSKDREKFLSLENININKVKVFSLKNEIYDCIVLPEDVYDGDTVKAIFIRNNEPMKFSVRLAGIDTPELRPSKKKVDRDIEIQRAKEARDALINHISNEKLQVEFHGPDKYGFRVVGTLYIINKNNIKEKLNVNQWMIENKYAIEYNGKKKKNHIWK